MKLIKKPWGHEEIWAQTEKYVGKILTINPGHRLSLQYHEVKEETIYVLQGNLTIWESDSENDYILCAPGSTFHVEPKKIHRFGAHADEPSDVKILEVSTPEISDVVRLADDYRR
jgi:mannose-6-phosphate isomerase